ncbi:MAG: hypothetical protein DDT42_02104 [candidate division WS2 bacterium]|uniref:Uncharacterized protein n=1 Tax=Psychracetigena formicireducens TaxID=2986056 RepID=A0A9E2BIK5_PSYF1|nr:hypothetical protein [Candidatus Psychracetigena formicireducens]
MITFLVVDTISISKDAPKALSITGLSLNFNGPFSPSTFSIIRSLVSKKSFLASGSALILSVATPLSTFFSKSTISDKFKCFTLTNSG